MKTRDYALEVITDACLIWLPADLLYLYFAGGWDEPNRIILVAELILLPLISLLGIWRVVDFIRRKV